MKNIKILGLPLPLYITLLIFAIICMETNCLPNSAVPALFFLMIIGEGLNFIGKTTPVIRDYLGGTAVCILGASVIGSLGIISDQTISTVDAFVNKSGFTPLFIGSLITGSLFGVDRDLLLKTAIRILPVSIVALAAGLCASGLMGILLGEGFWEGILFIGIPMTGGGMATATVPLSEIYANVLNSDASVFLSKMSPATVLGNCTAIIFGGIANNIGNKFPYITGNGILMKKIKKEGSFVEFKPTFANLATGMILAFSFYQIGAFLNHYISIVPIYAWMIIIIMIVKLSGIMGEELEDGAREWGQFVIKSWTGTILTGVGLTLIDFSSIMSTITPLYLLAILVILTTITLTAAFMGKLVGFYPLESSIAAGMCLTNMGVSGNVAVLSSAKRMRLLAYAQIASKTGSAIILTLGGILIHILA